MKRIILFFVFSVFWMFLSDTPLFASNPVSESDSREYVDEFSKFYLIAGGSGQLAKNVDNSASSFSVSLGGGYHFTPSLSCELGAAYEFMHLESNAEVGVGGVGVMAVLAYHKSIPGNLKYIPQLETDYLTFSIDNNRFNFVGLSLAPLAFEYRDEDSFVGFTAAIGELGVFYPISGFADKAKPVYVFSFNQVSLGLVVYF